MNQIRPERRNTTRVSPNGQNSPKTSARSHEHADRIQYPDTCTAVIGSMTQTMKAQSVLATAAIRAAVTKLSSTKSQTGCVYGLDFSCRQSQNVRQILSDAGIAVRQYLGGE